MKRAEDTEENPQTTCCKLEALVGHRVSLKIGHPSRDAALRVGTVGTQNSQLRVS